MSDFLWQFIIPLIFSMLFFARYLGRKKTKTPVQQLLDQGAVVVDVRSAQEFSAGNYPGSLNIPLEDIESKIHEIDHDRTVLLCCASGARSGMARQILRKKGYLNVVNVGSWQALIQK